MRRDNADVGPTAVPAFDIEKDSIDAPVIDFIVSMLHQADGRQNSSQIPPLHLSGKTTAKPRLHLQPSPQEGGSNVCSLYNLHLAIIHTGFDYSIRSVLCKIQRATPDVSKAVKKGELANAITEALTLFICLSKI